MWYITLDKIQIEDETLTQSQIERLDPLLEDLDEAKKIIYDRILLYSEIYLTPTQKRRWFLFFSLGSIKDVADEESVSTTAIHKSLFGTRDNEKSRSKIKSPIEKIKYVVDSDIQIQEQLLVIQALHQQINEIKEEYL